MQFPITIGLRRSRLIDAGVMLVALLASSTTLVFPQSTAIQLLMLSAIWVAAGGAWWRLSPKLSAIRLERSGQVSIAHHGDNEFSAAELLPDATVHPWLTLVRFKTDEGDFRTLIATVDTQNRQDFRRLRVFLRWQADFNGPADDA